MSVKRPRKSYQITESLLNWWADEWYGDRGLDNVRPFHFISTLFWLVIAVMNRKSGGNNITQGHYGRHFFFYGHLFLPLLYHSIIVMYIVFFFPWGQIYNCREAVQYLRSVLHLNISHLLLLFCCCETKYRKAIIFKYNKY